MVILGGGADIEEKRGSIDGKKCPKFRGQVKIICGNRTKPRTFAIVRAGMPTGIVQPSQTRRRNILCMVRYSVEPEVFRFVPVAVQVTPRKIGTREEICHGRT